MSPFPSLRSVSLRGRPRARSIALFAVAFSVWAGSAALDPAFPARRGLLYGLIVGAVLAAATWPRDGGRSAD